MRPPDSLHSSCPPQETGGQDDGSVDSPLVAQEALVSGVGESTGSTAQIPTGSSGCNQAAVIPRAAQEPDTVAPNCVAIVGQESRDAGSQNERLSLLPIALESPLESLTTHAWRANSPGTRTEPTCSAIFAHSLRESIRESYDSRLAGYFA